MLASNAVYYTQPGVAAVGSYPVGGLAARPSYVEPTPVSALAPQTRTFSQPQVQTQAQTLQPQSSIPASMTRLTSFTPTEEENPAYLVLKPDLRTVVSPFRRVLVPETPVSELFLELIEPYHERLAMVDASTGHQVKYGQLASGIRRVASSLFNRGVRQGDVVAILAPNIPEYPVVAHAAWLYGAVATTLDPEWTDDELLTQLRDLQVRFVFTIPAQADRISSLWSRLGSEPGSFPREFQNIYVFGRPEPGSGHSTFSDLLKSESLFPDHAVDPHNQVAAVFYVKDANGALRGLEFTHYNLTAAIVQALAYDDISSQDHLFATIPFHNIVGLNIQLNVALARGVTVVVFSGTLGGSLRSVLDQYQVSRLYTSSFDVVHNLRSVHGPGLYLKCLVFAGTGVASKEIQQLEDTLGINVRQLFGISESIVTHAVLKGSAIDHIASSGAPEGSIGQLLPNVETLVLDNRTGCPCPANFVGELLIRAPQCCSGYVKPETAPKVDPDGWIRTGLLGFYDKKGFFYVRKAN